MILSKFNHLRWLVSCALPPGAPLAQAPGESVRRQGAAELREAAKRQGRY